jgi:glycosyltransferase involved in cell wall biosynthesis
MPVDVSVVMGCYNSEATLEEALDSVLGQEFTGNFELVAVDDGSSDSTLQILRTRAIQDDRLRIIVHEKNRGGGASRNSAIRETAGQFVLDFDSDNVLGEHALQTMHNFISEHPDLHGALFEEQRVFGGRNTRRYNPYRYYTETSPLELGAIFRCDNAEFGNLMCRSEAYTLAGGYPEHHGFDTQGFCMRFLSRGLRAQVAPGSFYWHRTNGSKASYFERVFAAGRFNLNTYLTYEDMMEQFSEAALEAIMSSQIFRRSSLGEGSIGGRLKELERSGVPVLRGKRALPPGSKHELFVRGVVALREQEYEEALRSFIEIARAGVSLPILHFNVVRCTLGISGTEPGRLIEESLKTTRRLVVRTFPITRGWNLIDRGLVKSARLILAAHGFEDPISQD